MLALLVIVQLQFATYVHAATTTKPNIIMLFVDDRELLKNINLYNTLASITFPN